VSQFFGAATGSFDGFWQGTILDASWYLRAGRRDMSSRVRSEYEYGARNRFWGLWNKPGFFGGDAAPGYCFSDQDVGWGAARWSPWQKAARGVQTLKYIMGRTVNANGVALGGATIEAFLTGNNMFVRATLSDSNGNYEVGTEYPGNTHYLVAYYPGAPDMAGTTVNTLVPTNRDGT